MAPSVVGPELDGLAICNHGVINLAPLGEHHGKIVVRFLEVGLESDGGAVRSDGLLGLALLSENGAQAEMAP